MTHYVHEANVLWHNLCMKHASYDNMCLKRMLDYVKPKSMILWHNVSIEEMLHNTKCVWSKCHICVKETLYGTMSVWSINRHCHYQPHRVITGGSVWNKWCMMRYMYEANLHYTTCIHMYACCVMHLHYTYKANVWHDMSRNKMLCDMICLWLKCFATSLWSKCWWQDVSVKEML